ncbi:MAG: hypothetical protein RL430_1979 [Actinomycetota bacterium]
MDQSMARGNSHQMVSEYFSPLIRGRDACGCVTRLGHTINEPTGTSS